MACKTVAALVVAAPIAQLGKARVMSSQHMSFSSKLRGCNKSHLVMSAAPQTGEQNLAGLTSMALLAAAIIPEIAEAAQPGISPSLRNLLFSVAAGGVVLTGLGVAVAGVSTFDPVKRR